MTSLIGEPSLYAGLPFAQALDQCELDVIAQQVKKNINCPETSSFGRLFDAVSALLGIRTVIEYDAQAAIELEMIAYRQRADSVVYPFSVPEQGGVRQIRIGDMLQAILRDIRNNITPSRISARFHNTVARMIFSECSYLSGQTGIRQVVLSGGVFQNRMLLRKTISLLQAGAFQVVTHHQVPCNDGGISLGQAMIGVCALQ